IIDDILKAEEAEKLAAANARAAQAQYQEALNRAESERATQTASDSTDLAKAQRGCSNASGVWENNNCYWNVTSAGFICKKGKRWDSGTMNGTCKRNNERVESTKKFAAGMTLKCSKDMMGNYTDYGCSWNGGAVSKDQTARFPSLDELIANSDIADGANLITVGN
ncbi:MAG: hypothetical protein LBR35_00610, partial [Rickettsiales bacterium]|nr:hypothetical protein [Rickettsiales bacterium]